MTSASLSGLRMLPGGLGNKGEPPPSRPPTKEGPRPRGGGWLPCGSREAVECQAFTVALGIWDRPEGGLPNQFIYFPLRRYVTLGQCFEGPQ